MWKKNKKNKLKTLFPPIKFIILYWKIEIIHNTVDNFINFTRGMLINLSPNVNKNVEKSKFCGKIKKNVEF